MCVFSSTVSLCVFSSTVSLCVCLGGRVFVWVEVVMFEVVLGWIHIVGIFVQ